MDNQKISTTLEQLADLLEFQGANAFRLRAYRNGSRIIRDLPDPIEKLVNEDFDLTTLDGIGKSTAEKCKELVQTGTLKQLEAILTEVPRTVLDLLRIPNLGAKKAAKLFNELGIANLQQLQEACEAGQVATLSGFGEKTQASILDGIAIASAANERIYWSKADDLAESLKSHMTKCSEVRQIEFAGSYRRGKETVGDLDILVDSQNVDAVMDHFATYPEIVSTIGRGDTKLSVRLDNSFQIDLRVVPDKSFGAALQYFTGSKEHNVELRSRAKNQSMRINEWGVFKIDGDQETYCAGAEEKDVYEALGLPWIPPELREHRNEFELAQSSQLPELIQLQDIVGDLHMHTTATDGKESIEGMADAAKARGLQYIAITDHSKRVTMANGLDSDRLLAQWEEIDRFNKNSDGEFWIFKGIECDILESGPMDLPDETLAQADWVLASVHYGQKQSKQEITDRITGAISNPHVNAIAHPTGRLLNRREAYQVDMQAVMQAAQEHNKILELNANPARLDLHDVHLSQAVSKEISIVINSDAHSIKGLDVLKFGIKQARRGGLTKADVMNCLDLDEFKKAIEFER